MLFDKFFSNEIEFIYLRYLPIFVVLCCENTRITPKTLKELEMLEKLGKVGKFRKNTQFISELYI